MPDLAPTSVSKAATPLWVISLFVSLTEVMTGIAATQTSSGVQVALTAFVIAFPLLVASMFFLFLWSRPQNLYSPSEYQGTNIREYVDALRRDVESEIDQLYALSMSQNAFSQLEKLSTGTYPDFWIDPHLKAGLALELNYFKILGYIKFDKDPSVKDVEYLLSKGDAKGDHRNDDLCNYISVTPLAHKFIVLRKKAQERAQERLTRR